jgi:lipoprotein-anchoring transpeptidase ErfK/SrfK
MTKWRVTSISFVLFSLFFALVPGVEASAAYSADAVYYDTTYVVKPGDNLFRIALNHGLTTQELARANGITDVTRVFAGQVLVIPSRGSYSGSSASAAPASSEGSTYVVKPGDTLFRIALNHGLSTQALAQANGISNSSRIYVGQALKIPGRSAATTASPSYSQSSAGGGSRWIDINLSTQRVTAFEGSRAVFSTAVSTGISWYPTVTGRFSIYHRTPSQTMDGRRLGFNYVLPNVPYVMYFYRDYAIHGTYWHSNFGTPMSHGCVNMSTADARWLYNWSSYGTLVNVHY